MHFNFHRCVATILIGVAILPVAIFVRAQTVDELQGKIFSTNAQLQKLNQEIADTNKTLNNLGTQKNTLNTSITQLTLTQKKLETEIKVTQIKVDAANTKISQLGLQISDKEGKIATLLASIKEAVRVIYEQDAYTLPEVAFSNDSFSGLWDDVEALGQFNQRIAENVDQLRVLKTDLEYKTAQKNTEKKNYLGQKAVLGDQKKIALDTKAEKARILAQTKNQESAYSKLLKQKLAQKDALEAELRTYEQTLKFILDPTSIPPRGKKVFSQPLAVLSITQQFGKTSSSGRLYASGTHNGTDFRASVGTPVKAVLNGVVMGTGNTDTTCPGASYGKWVLIKHNNGLASLYAHFSLIKVSAGDTVATGDTIGYSGNTGYSTGPHLHLTVFAAAAVKIESRPSVACNGRTYTMPLAAINAYLDPMDYL